ncbi:MAG TPA: MMPL family transporter [Prosthecobacter sp.]|nr:MMPL family transporter [Prosthecobacter sp.]
MKRGCLLGLIIAPLLLLGFWRLRLETDILATLPSGVPEVHALKLLRDGFGGGSDLLIALEAPDDAVAAEAVAGLGELLRQKTALVKEVHWAQPLEQQAESGAALLAWVLQNADPARLKAWQASVTGEAAAGRLRKALETVGTSMDTEKVQRASYDPLGLLESLDTSAMGTLEGSMFGLTSEDGRFRVLLVTPAASVGNYKAARAWLDQIEAEVANWRQEAGASDIIIRYTGEPVFQAEIGAGIERDMSSTIGTTEILIALLFWIMFRRWKPLLWIQLLLGLSMIITLGLGGLLVGKLSIMSLGFAAIVLGIIVDYAVLIIQEARQHPALTSGQLRRLAAPGIVAGACTTATVFLSLLFSGLPGLAEMGLLVALGVISGLGVMLTFAPKLAAGRLVAGKENVTSQRPVSHLPAVLGTIVLIGGSGLVFAWQGMPVFQSNADALRPTKSTAWDVLQWIQERLGQLNEASVPVLQTGPVGDLKARAISLQSLLEQARKDGAILKYSVPTPLITDTSAQTANRPVIEWLIAEQPRLEQAMDAAGFTEAGMGLLRGVTRVWKPALAGPWPQSAAQSAAAPVLGRLLATGDGAREAGVPEGEGVLLASVSVAGSPALPDRQRLQDLQTRLKAQPGAWAAGWEMLGGALSQLVRRDLNRQLLPIFGLLALTLLITFRNVRDLLLSVLLLATGLGALAATMTLLGQSWNLASLAAIPLLLGTGIDYGIHIMLALKRTNNDIYAVRHTTARAVFFSGMTTVIGFASLFFAGNRGISSLGLACCLGTLWILLIVLWLLPHWRAWLSPRRGRP